MSFPAGTSLHPRLVLAGALAFMSAAATLAQAQQSQDTNFRMEGDKPIQIESDQLEVQDNQNTALFTGNVSVTQGATQMRSSVMKVFYAEKPKNPAGTAAKSGKQSSPVPATTGQASSEIDRIEVSGKVYVSSGNQTATGDQGSFDMRANVLRLTGSRVVLSEDGNVVTGCALTVQTETGNARLEPCSGGRVRMVITPGSQ